MPALAEDVAYEVNGEAFTGYWAGAEAPKGPAASIRSISVRGRNKAVGRDRGYDLLKSRRLGERAIALFLPAGQRPVLVSQLTLAHIPV